MSVLSTKSFFNDSLWNESNPEFSKTNTMSVISGRLHHTRKISHTNLETDCAWFLRIILAKYRGAYQQWVWIEGDFSLSLYFLLFFILDFFFSYMANIEIFLYDFRCYNWNHITCILSVWGDWIERRWEFGIQNIFKKECSKWKKNYN